MNKHTFLALYDGIGRKYMRSLHSTNCKHGSGFFVMFYGPCEGCKGEEW